MKRPSLALFAALTLGGRRLFEQNIAFASDQFIPLTSLPGLSSVSASSLSLPAFINNLYRLSIGAAAFFAVIQIAWAGFIFLSSADSISKNTKAKQKITNAVIGLVLVLSPYVVFSVINPKILDISLNFSGLQTKNGTTSSNGAASTATSPPNTTSDTPTPPS